MGPPRYSQYSPGPFRGSHFPQPGTSQWCQMREEVKREVMAETDERDCQKTSDEVYDALKDYLKKHGYNVDFLSNHRKDLGEKKE